MVVPPTQKHEGYVAAKKAADAIEKKVQALRSKVEENVHEHGVYRGLDRLIHRLEVDIQLIQIAIGHQIQ